MNPSHTCGLRGWIIASCAPGRRFFAFCLAWSLFLGGCHVRTQEFHCKLEGDLKTDFEFAMSPTESRYRDEVFSFVDERGNQRLYRHSSGRELIMDLSTMQLGEYPAPRPDPPRAVAGEERFGFLRQTPPLRRWNCERYRVPGGG